MKKRYIRKVVLTKRIIEIGEEDQILESDGEASRKWWGSSQQDNAQKAYLDESFGYNPSNLSIMGEIESYREDLGMTREALDIWTSWEPIATTISATLTKYLRIIFDFVIYAIAVTISSSNINVETLNGRFKKVLYWAASVGLGAVIYWMTNGELSQKAEDIASLLMSKEKKNSCTNNNYINNVINNSNNVNISN